MLKKILVLLVLFGFSTLLSAQAAGEGTVKLNVFASILPQKFFIEQIGGELVNVEVLVGPGMSPHTYEPLPQQMSSLSRADIFFAIGVPFEKVLRKKLVSVCPNLKIVDTDTGIQRRMMQTYEESGHVHSSDCQHGSGEADPHIWLDPELAIIQGKNIAQALKEALPAKAEVIDARFADFTARLRALMAELTTELEPVKGQTMLVFHPAFGYFADRFGLKQKAIEIEGKEPAPRQLVELIRRCRAENIHIVFVQKQFPTSAAETVARSINGSVVIIDPLSENYIVSLQELGNAVVKGLLRK